MSNGISQFKIYTAKITKLHRHFKILHRQNFEFGGNYIRMIVPYNWKPEEGEVEIVEKNESAIEESTLKIIVEIISDNPNVTIPEIAERLKLNPRGIAKHFKILQEKGLIRRVGPDKGGHWEVIENN